MVPSMTRSVIAPGRVAVVTGAARGIGAAAARRFAAEGMRLALFDRDEGALTDFARSLDADCIPVSGDVAVAADLVRLRDATYDRFGEVALLMNNAGIVQGAGPWDDPEQWRRQLDVNFGGILSAQHIFVPRMIAADQPSAVVNLGSKEGITTPPGNAAYTSREKS
jgi:NAD(P)-dependent dehydrogenase (short-subunit alcohol dehydrogenase family)